MCVMVCFIKNGSNQCDCLNGCVLRFPSGVVSSSFTLGTVKRTGERLSAKNRFSAIGEPPLPRVTQVALLVVEGYSFVILRAQTSGSQ